MKGQKNQKKKNRWFYWGCVIILCILFWPVASGLIGLALGIMIAKWLISVFRKDNGPQKYLEGRREELARDRQQWQIQQAFRKQQQSLARTELEKLKKQAYWWDSQARKTGSSADARRAQDCWNRVNETQRKLDSL